MAELSASSSTPRSRVVRPLSRAAERPCARPGCPAPARATLTFSYATAEAVLDRLSEGADPQGYDLCARHAARTEAPRGWDLADRRPEDDRAGDEPPAPAPRDLGSEATVAVLAAALRAVPGPVAAPDAQGPATPTAEAVDVVLVPSEVAAETAEPAPVTVAAVAGPVPAPSPQPQPSSTSGRRSVVETLLSAGPAPQPARRSTVDEPTVELPAIRTPRRVPAAGDRGPATDW